MSCHGLTLYNNNCKRVARYDVYCRDHYKIECSICYEFLTPRNAPKLKCGHLFHLKCLCKWIVEDNYTCPLCRSQISDEIITLFNDLDREETEETDEIEETEIGESNEIEETNNETDEINAGLLDEEINENDEINSVYDEINSVCQYDGTEKMLHIDEIKYIIMVFLSIVIINFNGILLLYNLGIIR